jgi:hypothetical protein
MRRYCAAETPSIQTRKRAGFRPEGRGPPTRRRRQPALGNAPMHSIASGASRFHSHCRFPQRPTKEDPGAKKGPGSIAGWVRGWGLGGTPPGAMRSTLGLPRGSYPRNYFRALPRRGRRRRRARVRFARSAGSSTWRPSGNSRYRKRMRRRPSSPPRPSTT